MDRNTVIGFILIFFIMIAWAYFTMPTEEQMRQQQLEQARQDSIAAAQAETDTPAVQEPSDEPEQSREPAQIREDSQATPEMGMFRRAGVADTSIITVKTPLYDAGFTNVGAGPSKFTLREYDTWDHQPVQMIRDTTRSPYSLGFLTSENYNVETRNILFEQITGGDVLEIGPDETETLEYALTLENGGRLVYVYTFNGGTYEVDLTIRYENLSETIIGRSVDFGWQSPLRFTEKDRSQESMYTSAFVYAGGELEQLLLTEAGSRENNINGNIDWVATRTKFFAQIIKSASPTNGALLTGQLNGDPNAPSTIHNYEAYLRADITPQQTTEFRLYLGPLSYNTLKNFDPHAYDMVDVGWAWIRWFADPLVRYIIIPYFGLTKDVMNYGLAIILFSILVKLVLYPLTKKSFKSMAAMKELQPQIKELQEKHKDNPQKQQEATLKLYRKAKVNPLGGCLPNLLQFPILITLWRYFQSSILIRQEAFLWAPDLSAPDYILSLPFSIPFLGDQLAGFVLLMTVAMVFQSRLTGGMSSGGGPSASQMKALQYIFPVMLLFIFNNFAAGLSLYYLIYNVMSIGQQLLINKQLDKEKIENEADK